MRGADGVVDEVGDAVEKATDVVGTFKAVDVLVLFPVVGEDAALLDDEIGGLVGVEVCGLASHRVQEVDEFEYVLDRRVFESERVLDQLAGDLGQALGFLVCCSLQDGERDV